MTLVINSDYSEAPAATELSFMPVTISTHEYTNQTSTSLTYSDQTSTTLSFTIQNSPTASFTEQSSTALSYENIFTLEGTLYGAGYYNEESYTGRPFVIGRVE